MDKLLEELLIESHKESFLTVSPAGTVYNILSSYCHNKNWCYVSLKALSKELGKSESTVAKDIKKLVSLGYVTKKRSVGGSNVYILDSSEPEPNRAVETGFLGSVVGEVIKSYDNCLMLIPLHSSANEVIDILNYVLKDERVIAIERIWKSKEEYCARLLIEYNSDRMFSDGDDLFKFMLNGLQSTFYSLCNIKKNRNITFII